jgi:hypothetical protein
MERCRSYLLLAAKHSLLSKIGYVFIEIKKPALPVFLCSEKGGNRFIQ